MASVALSNFQRVRMTWMIEKTNHGLPRIDVPALGKSPNKTEGCSLLE